MLARVSACIVAAVLLAACGFEQSKIDPEAVVTISGKILDSAGHPLANSKVALLRGVDEVTQIRDFVSAAGTIGIVCLTDTPPVACQNALTRTDDAGAYTFTIAGGVTQRLLGEAATMAVVVRAPAGSSEVGGPAVAAAFKVQTTTLKLPDLHIWDPKVEHDFGNATDSWNWPKLPSGDGGSPTYGLEFADRYGWSWWLTGPTRSGKTIDVRIFEDLNGVSDLAAEAKGTATGTAVAFNYVSGSVAFRGTSGPPASRGALCAPLANGGVGTFSPCWLTSGNLGDQTSHFYGGNGVVIDLGRETAISLVVAKGCSGRCSLALSADLATWSDAGGLSGEYATAPITRNSAARYVRITGSTGYLRQIAIW